MESEKTVFLVGKKVVLRPLKVEDLPFLQRWINDPDIRFFLSTCFPQTMEDEKEWLEKTRKSSSDIVFGMETLEGQFIGNMGLHRINFIDRRAGSGSFIGVKELWGKGYGQDAKMQLLNYAFNTLGLNKVCSEALIYNKRSIGHNLKCGYEIVCIKKHHIFKNGKLYDAAYLECFRKNWLPLWKKYNK